MRKFLQYLLKRPLTWMAAHLYLIHNFGFDWYVAAVDSAVSIVPLGAACWLIDNNLRYYQPGKGSYLCKTLPALSRAGRFYRKTNNGNCSQRCVSKRNRFGTGLITNEYSLFKNQAGGV